MGEEAGDEHHPGAGRERRPGGDGGGRGPGRCDQCRQEPADGGDDGGRLTEQVGGHRPGPHRGLKEDEDRPAGGLGHQRQGHGGGQPPGQAA